jgi:transposase
MDHQVEGTMANAQRAAIQSALRLSSYNLSAAAERLRIGRTTLYRLIDQYDIEFDEEARRSGASRRKLSAENSQPRVTLIDGNWYLEQRGTAGRRA